MKRSSSGDYNSIGLSLKRVKISTSPGEICLDRDIESLIFSKRWTSTANHIQGDGDRNENSPRSSSSLDRRGIRAHVELYSHHARLVRDPVDPLKLRLTCLHQSSTTSTPSDSRNNTPINDNNNTTHAARPTTATSSPLPPERWTFLIHIPRMYPHIPPTITHVNREYITNNENFAFLGNNINLARHNSSLSAAMVASSVMQSHYLEPPAPEQVLINLLPPTELHSHNTRPQIGSGLSSSINNKQHLDVDSATSVCNTWTPVSTLQELLDFLIGLPGRRREWWATDVIRRSRDSLAASPLTIAPPINNNTMKSYFSDSDSKEQHESQESYMSLGLDEDNNREMTGGHQQHVESMIEDSQSPGRMVTTMMEFGIYDTPSITAFVRKYIPKAATNLHL